MRAVQVTSTGFIGEVSHATQYGGCSVMGAGSVIVRKQSDSGEIVGFAAAVANESRDSMPSSLVRIDGRLHVTVTGSGPFVVYVG